MKAIKTPLFITSIFLLLHTFFPLFAPYLVVVFSLMLAPFLVIWLVYRVLKDGEPSHKTFTEYFYEDEEIKRLNNLNDSH
ncbi:hypothetical protein GC194_02230 [bacterium]|nr:hypothetical protein [bacterium]